MARKSNQNSGAKAGRIILRGLVFAVVVAVLMTLLDGGTFAERVGWAVLGGAIYTVLYEWIDGYRRRSGSAGAGGR